MQKPSNIEHKGIVKSINSETISVSIIAEAACASCQVKGSCSASDLKEKIIEIPQEENNNFNLGEQVNVILRQSLGVKALFLGYLFPFIILITSLIVISSFTNNELLSGLLSLGLLVPYYFILHLKRDYLKKEFSFTLKKA